MLGSSAGRWPLEVLLTVSGRVALALGDSLVATIDGINAARNYLYSSNHNHHERKLVPAWQLSQALLTGLTTAIGCGIYYHLESNRKMGEELRSVWEEYILGRGKD